MQRRRTDRDDSLAPLTAIHLGVVLQIVSRGDIVEPSLIVEIPSYGFLDTLLKLELRFPAKFTLELARVDGIAQVVAGAVGDVGDEVKTMAFGIV